MVKYHIPLNYLFWPNPIEKILEEILVLFSDEENTRKSARIFKFLEEICESEN